VGDGGFSLALLEGFSVTLLGVAGWVLGATAVLGSLAAAFVKIRSSVDNQTAEIWKGEAEAQKARADRLETALTELSERVARLEAENRHLSELVTGQAAISELRTLVLSQHRELTALIRTAPEGQG
jgi:cell shape-determining protein MreC